MTAVNHRRLEIALDLVLGHHCGNDEHEHDQGHEHPQPEGEARIERWRATPPSGLQQRHRLSTQGRDGQIRRTPMRLNTHGRSQFDGSMISWG